MMVRMSVTVTEPWTAPHRRPRYAVETLSGLVWSHVSGSDDRAKAEASHRDHAATGYRSRLVDTTTGAILMGAGSPAAKAAAAKRKAARAARRTSRRA